MTHKPKGGLAWPDIRGWAVLGFFALAFYLLRMMQTNPKLLADASFMQFATLIISGGVILVGQNLFGGTKSGAETTAKIADAYAATPVAPPAAAPIPPPVGTPAASETPS